MYTIKYFREKLVSCSFFTRFLVSSLFFCVTAFLWYLSCYIPSCIVIESCESQTTCLLEKRDEMVKKSLRIPEATKQLEQMMSFFEKYSSKTSENQASLVEQISSLIKSSGLSLVLQAGPCVKKNHTSFSIVFYEYQMKGSYEGIVLFFKELEITDLEISCTACSCVGVTNEVFCRVTFSFLRRNT